MIWALQAGYRHIDCATIYGNEAEIGEALQETLGTDKVSQYFLFTSHHSAFSPLLAVAVKKNNSPHRMRTYTEQNVSWFFLS